jgi:hypothetical protein
LRSINKSVREARQDSPVTFAAAPISTLDCASPLCARLLVWWRHRKEGSEPPTAGAVDLAVELPQLLPFCFEIDVEPTGFRLRRVGPSAIAGIGPDSTGRTIDEYLYGEYLADTLRPLSMVVRSRRAVLERGHPWRNRKNEAAGEALYVPLLGHSNGPVSQLLVVNDYGPLPNSANVGGIAKGATLVRVLD